MKEFFHELGKLPKEIVNAIMTLALCFVVGVPMILVAFITATTPLSCMIVAIIPYVCGLEHLAEGIEELGQKIDRAGDCILEPLRNIVAKGCRLIAS